MWKVFRRGAQFPPWVCRVFIAIRQQWCWVHGAAHTHTTSMAPALHFEFTFYVLARTERQSFDAARSLHRIISSFWRKIYLVYSAAMCLARNMLNGNTIKPFVLAFKAACVLVGRSVESNFTGAVSTGRLVRLNVGVTHVCHTHDSIHLHKRPPLYSAAPIQLGMVVLGDQASNLNLNESTARILSLFASHMMPSSLIRVPR